MKLLYFLILTLLVTSCRSKEKKLFIFDPKMIEEKEIALSEFADDITYIPLDNSFPISLIYSPRYILNNSIYLSALNSGIMVFDKNGKFIRKIGKIGRGPGEYVYYFNFTVDDKNETVYVLDLNTIKVFSKNGKYLRHISLGEFGNEAESVEFYNSFLFVSYYLQFENVNQAWIVLDTLGNFIKAKKRIDHSINSNYGLKGGLYKVENRIYHWNPWCDTVFSILPDLSCEPSFLFAPWENRVPKSIITDLTQFQTFNPPNVLFETRNILVCWYRYNKKIKVALKDKNSTKSYSTVLEVGPPTLGTSYIGGFVNDLDGGVRFRPENYFSDDNNREYLFGLVDANEIVSVTKNDEFKNSKPKYPDKKKKLESFGNSLKETDNQILMIVRIKQ